MTQEIPAHVQRMQAEFFELTGRIEKLLDFIRNNPIFHTLDEEEQTDMELQCHYMQLYSFRLESRIDRARFNLIDGTETDDEDANEIIESWEKPVPDSRMPESFVFGDNTKNIAKIVTPETMKAAMRLDEMQEMKHPDKAIPDSFKIIDDGEVAGHVALKVSDPTKLWPFPTGSRGFIGKSKDSK